MTIIWIIIFGIIFGGFISYAGLNRYNTIAGLSVLKDFTVAKTIMLVIGIGGFLLMFEIMGGEASFHIKPLYTIGTILGGLIFGAGMSILGYCPGTLPISLGQGSLDALIGICGGLVGGILYTILYPVITPILGYDLGEISLFSLMGNRFSSSYIFILIIISLIMIFGAFLLNRLDRKNGIRSKRWLVTAFGLAILNLILFYQGWHNRPLGASSSYPYIGDILLGLTSTSYFQEVSSAGNWQIWFLLGAFIAGIGSQIGEKKFKFTLIHSLWKSYMGNSPIKRIIWAFIGGFLLIFGARMADGCTSGHIISGGMQVAMSSYIFAISTFGSFLLTGHLFYKK